MASDSRGRSGCCSLRTFVFAIGIVFLLVQTTFLIITFVLMRNVETHVAEFIDWFSYRGVFLPQPQTLTEAGDLDQVSYRTHLIRKSGDYLAIPITINVVLVIADTLLIWAAAARSKLLLWPWMILHAIEFLFFLALLIFLMVIVPEPWFKVVLFLIGCPLVVMLAFFWFVVKCLYNYLRDLNLKVAVAAVYQLGGKQGQSPLTMYTPDPHHWDQPVPVWAVRPPPSAWDPEYLQGLDPRYHQQPYHNHGSRRPKSVPTSRRSRPTQVLPDGTIVVPIGSEPEDNEDDNASSGPAGSVRSLSDKFNKKQKIPYSESTGLTGSTSIRGAQSDDRASIISLSDKYRQQEEVEIFHEHYHKPPPEPVRPPVSSSKSSQKS